MPFVFAASVSRSPASRAMPTPLRSLLASLRAFLSTQRVRQQRTQTDRGLALALLDAFEDAAVSTDEANAGLHFFVFEGAVTVYGHVATDAERARLLERVAAVPGVRAVTDHLRVESAPASREVAPRVPGELTPRGAGSGEGPA